MRFWYIWHRQGAKAQSGLHSLSRACKTGTKIRPLVPLLSYACIQSNLVNSKSSELEILFRIISSLNYIEIEIKFVCFVALRPKSTATVIEGRSVHLTTLSPGQA